jgi:hypothetical protein
MALNDAALAGALKDIFRQMRDNAGGTPKDDDWYAGQLAKAVTDQIKTADVNAGIAVSIPSTSTEGSPSQGSTSAKGSLS